jgi:hypothetical protein
MGGKTESDFRPLICDDCGKEEGPFYIDTDDNETLCLDCVLALPSEERRDFEEALGKSEHWELYRQGNGRVTLRCVECCEVHEDGPWDDDDDGYVAMEATACWRSTPPCRGTSTRTTTTCRSRSST